MAKKRIMGVLLSLALVFSMTACSKSEETTKKEKKEKAKEEEVEDEDESEEESEDSEESKDTEAESESEESSEDTTPDSGNGIIDPAANIDQSNSAMGIMNILADSYDGFGEGIYLFSAFSGTDGMNTVNFRMSFIREIFENEDQIEICLAPEAAGKNMTAYLVPHHDNAEVYTQDYLMTLSDEIAKTEFDELADPEMFKGDLFLAEETYAPGFYDVLFVENGTTPVSYVTIQLVQRGSLSDYSEYDYYAMVKEDLDKHNMSDLYKVDFDKFYGCYEQGIWPDEYTWSGSGLPTLPCENPEATIVLDAVDPTSVTIRATLINQSEEESCKAIDEVFLQNNYNISYPDGDADANYRYVYVDIDDVPCEITYYGYEGELIVAIRNLVADELQ